MWSFLTVVLRQRYLVAGIPLVAAITVVAVSQLSPREYTAGASFLPEETASAQSGLGALASQFGMSLSRSASGSSPEFYVGLLQSREVLRDVITTPYRVSARPGFGGDLLSYFGIAPDAEAAVASATRRLMRLLTIRMDRGSGVVHVEVHTRYPELSVQIVGRFLALISDFNLQRRRSQARAEREFVEQRLAAVRVELAAAEDSLAGFYRRNRRFSDAPELVAEEARLQRQVSLRQQLYIGLAQNYEAAKIEEVRNTPVITLVERPEGSAAPTARRTIAKAIAAVFLAGFVGLALAFSRELFLRGGRSGVLEHEEFVRTWRGLLAGPGGKGRAEPPA